MNVRGNYQRVAYRTPSWARQKIRHHLSKLQKASQKLQSFRTRSLKTSWSRQSTS